MFIKTIRIIFVSLLVIHLLSSCTTSDSSDDALEGELSAELDGLGEEGEEAAASADGLEDELAAEEVEDIEKKESSGDPDEDEFLAEDAPAKPNNDELAEQDLQNELGKENSGKVAQGESTPPEEEQQTPQDPLPEEPVTQTAAMEQPSTAAVSSASKEGVSSDGFENINPSLPQEDLGVSDPLVAEVDPPLPSVKLAQEQVALAKINKDPFFRNGRVMNAVYIVRPGEDLSIISQKIFAEDKTAILLADNDYLLKGIEVGDKVYYNSPNRPEDNKQILTYYEDNKMAPRYYVTRKGDDIKKIGREVLGNEEGWREVWSTNEVLQTQALLPAGLKIRYWSGNEPSGSLELASSPPTSMEPPMASASTANTASAEPPPPDSETLAEIPSAEPAPLSSPDPGMATHSMAPETLSPAPSAEVLAAKSGDSSLMTMAAIAMIAIGVIAIVAIQIKNRKRDDGAIPPSLEFTKV